jgi:hypothetical protein
MSGARFLMAWSTSFSEERKKTVAWCQFAGVVPMLAKTCQR